VRECAGVRGHQDPVVHPARGASPSAAAALCGLTAAQGEFDLIRYRVTRESLLLPFKVTAYAEDFPADNRIEIHLRLRCDIPAHSSASNVRLAVPLPREYIRCGLASRRACRD
jgi:hypothetical protein